jgi:Gpi18-like mannosyltransferase
MKSIYFPLSQWIFYAGYSISGENVYGYKLLLFVFELITIFSIYLLIKKLGLERKFILLYALCPLPIIQFSLDAHVDGFGLPFLILSLLFYLNNKKVLSLIFLGLSFSIKPVGLVFLPILFFMEKTYVERIKILIIPFAVFFIQFLPYIFTANPFEAFLIYSKNWAYNGSVFLFLYHFIQDNQTARKVCSLILLVLLIPIAMSKKEFLWKVYYSVLLLFILSPVVHPWYIAWIAILLPVYPKRSGILFVCLSSLTAITILNYKLYGIWSENPWIITLEYVPVISFMIYEMFWSNSEIRYDS